MHRQNHSTPWVLALALTAACAGGANTLVDIDTLDDAESCPDGGVVIRSGIDTSKDGVLDNDEVETSEVVCNGETPSATLLLTTPLEPGDATCEHGGVKFEAGADDGTPGGIADDGILQPEEVDSTEYLCDAPPNEGEFVPFDPPEGAAGTATIRSIGGTGTNGDGGDGGDFDAYIDYGSIGGGVRLYKTGSADASWTYPASVSYDLGDVPWTVTTNTTVPMVANTSSLSDGDPYLLFNDDNLYVYNSSGVDDIVTGISVASGVTLTFEENYPVALELSLGGPPSNPAVGYVQIDLESDFHLAGTVTTTGIGANRPDLYLNVDVWVGEASGLVDLTGDDNPSGYGGDGGDFQVDGDDDDVDNTEEDPGAVFNEATVDTSGGNGLIGGDAGDIEFETNLQLFNAGDLTAVGGNGSDGSGGDGGDIDLDNDYASNLNSGTLDARGGRGTDGSGGSGGDVYIYNGYWGDVKNTGTITTDGGDAVQCTYGCSAGDAGDVEFDVYSNPVISSGDISAVGGDASLSSGTMVLAGPYGGDGGDFDSGSSYEDGWFDAEAVPMGDMVFSGSWDFSGGDGGVGGNGGDLDIDIDAEYVPNNQQILFLGYQGVDLSGGDGSDDGGDAGGAQFYTEYAEWNDGYDYGAGGPVINYVDFRTVGGNGAASNGGDGGYVELFTSEDYAHDAPWEQALNFGNITANGGSGPDGDGDGGAFYLWGFNGAENHGDVSCNGGNASGVESSGGDGAGDYSEWDDGIHIGADGGPVVNTGNLSARGGNATGEAGYGGDGETVQIVGTTVTNSGNIDVSGGNGTGADGNGGDAGDVLIVSMYGTTTNTASTIKVAGGSGSDSEGDDGSIIVDGQNQTNDF